MAGCARRRLGLQPHRNRRFAGFDRRCDQRQDVPGPDRLQLVYREFLRASADRHPRDDGVQTRSEARPLTSGGGPTGVGFGQTVQQSLDRILTTHVGSLPRPKDLLDLMKAKLSGAAYDKAAYDARVKSAVAECVRKQVESGIDIVSDGEQSKPGFFTYARERLEGFEERPQQKRRMFPDEVAAFPEYYEKYFKEAMTGGAIAPIVPLVCTGPVKYRGEGALERDIANLKAAAGGAHGAFLPAAGAGGGATARSY